MSITLNYPVSQPLEPSGLIMEEEGLAMAIKRIIMAKRECCLESLLETCSSFTWNQVFLEVDRMSRNGEILLKRTKSGEYRVCLPWEVMAQSGEAV